MGVGESWFVCAAGLCARVVVCVLGKGGLGQGRGFGSGGRRCARTSWNLMGSPVAAIGQGDAPQVGFASAEARAQWVCLIKPRVFSRKTRQQGGAGGFAGEKRGGFY